MDDVLDSIVAVLGEVLAEVTTFGTQKVLLNAKRFLIGTDQDDDKDRMGVSGREP